MDLVYIYYDNPGMLELQIKCWNAYVGLLRKLPTILLVDDGSPKSPAVDVVRRCGCQLPIKVFRIKENLPWNVSGARNLGCTHARGWIFVSDIDTLLPASQAQVLIEEHDLQQQYCYTVQRIRHANLQPINPGISTVVFHKKQFLRIGGYDEDYAGHYGKEDRDFLDRLIKIVRTRKILNVAVQNVQRSEIRDASTRGLDRDSSRNSALFLKKSAAGFPPVGPRLRFTWERVL